MEAEDRPSAWDRLGPFGQFLVGVVVLFAIGLAGVKAIETTLALTVRIPTVDGLPDRVSLCGRSYRRAEGGSLDLLTIEELQASDVEVVIVLPLRLQPCIDGPCNRGFPNAPDIPGCATIVFVKVVGDRYAAYSLQGGP